MLLEAGPVAPGAKEEGLNCLNEPVRFKHDRSNKQLTVRF